MMSTLFCRSRMFRFESSRSRTSVTLIFSFNSTRLCSKADLNKAGISFFCTNLRTHKSAIWHKSEYTQHTVMQQSINQSINLYTTPYFISENNERRWGEPWDQSRVNRWVFRARENCSVEVTVLTFGGSRFHVVAAATANARSEDLFDVSLSPASHNHWRYFS